MQEYTSNDESSKNNNCSLRRCYTQMAPVLRRGIQESHASQESSANQKSRTCCPNAPTVFAQSMEHFLAFFPLPSFSRLAGGSRAATIACIQVSYIKHLASQLHTSSNTSFSLYCVRAEHSTYLTAPSSLAMRSPSSFFTGAILCFASFSLTFPSSRRSTCVPTIKHGTPGQWWCTSGNHFSRTFSNEAGDVTEKQTRNTSV